MMWPCFRAKLSGWTTLQTTWRTHFIFGTNDSNKSLRLPFLEAVLTSSPMKPLTRMPSSPRKALTIMTSILVEASLCHVYSHPIVAPRSRSPYAPLLVMESSLPRGSWPPSLLKEVTLSSPPHLMSFLLKILVYGISSLDAVDFSVRCWIV